MTADYQLGPRRTLRGIGGLRLPPAIERLRASLTHLPNGCQVRTTRLAGGYGYMTVGGKRVLCHRIAWEAAHGSPIPEGMFVCHSCDNPPCCNPDHLFLGSHADNMRDMQQKGRVRLISADLNGNAKLTIEQALELCRRQKAGETYAALAAAYHISETTVWRIVRGETWSSVTNNHQIGA